MDDRATIYRGNSSLKGEYGYINPAKGSDRASAFATSNHYTILLDNLPSWRKYPKRSKSVIATTDEEGADQRGGTLIVLPYDGADIGVCPEDDIWYSFSELDMNRPSNNLENLNEWFQLNGFSDTKKLLSELMDVNNKNYEDHLKDEFLTRDDTGRLEEWVDMEREMSLWGFFNKIMAPKPNGFTMKKAGDTLLYTTEVWTDSECVLLRNTSDNIEMLNELSHRG